MSTKTYNLFPQRVVLHDCDGFDQYQSQIVDYCYDLFQSHSETPLYTLQGNGWQYQMQEDFPSWLWDLIRVNIEYCLHVYGFGDDQCKSFKKMFVLNIGFPQSYHRAHVHSGCSLSGVLWVKAPENSGDFSFHNNETYEQFDLFNKMSPESIDLHHIGSSFQIIPKEGQMILFPPNLRHCVLPNESDENRITIAFNLRLI